MSAPACAMRRIGCSLRIAHAPRSSLMPFRIPAPTALARTLALAAIAVGASLPAHAGSTNEPRGGVGLSIGTDLVVDRGFGDDGLIAVSYNDGADILDEAVRVASADDGGYW